MKNINFVKCHLCGLDNYKILFQSTLDKSDFNPKVITEDLKNTLGNYKKHSRIVKCKECGLVYTNPMENPDSLLKGYEDVIDQEYLDTEKYRKLLLLEHLKHIEAFKTKGKMLDIGCFAGYFLELAKQKGWDVYGIEPSNWARNVAKKRKVKIISESIDNAKLSDKTYDVITMWDVIEHLPNPRQVLKKCYDSLDDKGIIALGTPNIECLVAKIMGSNYPYILRMHHLFYSPKTLSLMLDSVGFKTIKVYNYGRIYPVSYILDRLQIDNKLFGQFKKIVNTQPWLANRTINLNIGDSFVIIAKKK